jgi:hypothetical protein
MSREASSLHGCLTNLFDRRSTHAQASGSLIERNGKVGLKSREVENNGRHLVMEEMCMRMLVDVFEARFVFVFMIGLHAHVRLYWWLASIHSCSTLTNMLVYVYHQTVHVNLCIYVYTHVPVPLRQNRVCRRAPDVRLLRPFASSTLDAPAW